MNISALPITFPADVEPMALDEVSGRTYDAAVQQFEGVFISMMLKEMRKTVGDGYFGGDKADAIGGLFDMTLGEELSRNGGLGITAALSRYRDVADSGQLTVESDELGEAR
ncbi:MAG: rod-binding protein [Planctomycetaceae bacterium]|nr:rod-binding protein [Planctomycetaceae bacterium]